MSRKLLVLILASVFLFAGILQAQYTPSFELKWSKAAGDVSWMGASTERGMAYYDGKLYVASRGDGSYVRILNASDGSLIDSIDASSLTGGALPFSGLSVSDDGKIFAANLTSDASTSPFKVYMWENDADNTPETVVEWSGAAVRVVDNLAVAGSVDNGTAVIYAAAGNTPGMYRWTMESDGIGGYVFKTAPDVFTLPSLASWGTPAYVAPMGPGPDADFWAGGRSITHARSYTSADVTTGYMDTHGGAGTSAINYQKYDGKEYVFGYKANSRYAYLNEVPAGSGTWTNRTGTTLALTDVMGSTTENINGDLTVANNGDGSFNVYVLATNNGIYAYEIWVEEPPVPNIIITELADPKNIYQARFFELYNLGDAVVDLDEGWKVRYYSNANTTFTNINLTGTIAPGSAFVIANSATNFESTYGFAPDMASGTYNSNGDDNIELVNPAGDVVDAFGVPGVQGGSSTDHNFADGRAVRKESVTIGNPTYDSSEWIRILNVDAPDGFDPGVWPSTIPVEISAAMSVSLTEIMVKYSLDVSSVDVADYSILGSDITLVSANIDPLDPTVVMLTASADVFGDAVLDTLIDAANADSAVFYIGGTSIALTNTTNPGGTIEEGYLASFWGIVSANDNYNCVWVNDDDQPYSGVLIFDWSFDSEVAVGDEILFTAERKTYNNLTELVSPVLLEVVSSGNEPFGPVDIVGADIDTSITADTDPAEKWEGQLVKITGAVIVDSLGTSYICTDDDGTTHFKVGDNAKYQLSDVLMRVGESYDIVGVVDYDAGKYRINPRGAADATPTPVELAGEYYIPKGANPQGFATLKDAVDQLNAFGVSGPVTFLLDADTLREESFTFAADLDPEEPVVVKPAPGKDVVLIVTPGVSKGNGAQMIGFDKGNVVFDGSNDPRSGSRNLLVTTETNDARVPFGLNTADADNVVIKNLVIENIDHPDVTVNFRYGVVINDVGGVTGHVVENCQVGSAAKPVRRDGLAPWGGSATANEFSFVGNEIYAGIRGITTVYLANTEIIGNTINMMPETAGHSDWRVPPTSSDGYNHGIYITGCSGNLVIANNTINMLEKANNTASYLIGIAFAGNSEAGDSPFYIINNMINVGPADETCPVYGIASRSANPIGNLAIYHNTIVVNNTASDKVSYGIGTHTGTTGAATVDLKNNIIINNHAGNAGSAAIGLTPSATVLTSDQNVLLSDQALVNFKGTTYADLAAWQAVGAGVNSVSKAVDFMSDTDLHLVDSTSAADADLVMPSVGIATDIDGDPRPHPNFAYAGADEGAEITGPLAGGDYYVPAAPGVQGFAKLKTAVDAINNLGVDGPVVLLLNADTLREESFTFAADLTAENNVVVKPAPGKDVVLIVAPGGSKGNGPQMIGFDKGYVVIDGSNDGSGSRNLIITNEAYADVPIGLNTADADTVVIRNLIIKNLDNEVDNFKYGVVTNDVAGIEGFVVENCQIGSEEFPVWRDGVAVWGSSAGPTQGIVLDNEIYSGCRGIATYVVNDCVFSGNTINMLPTTSGTPYSYIHGIYLTGASGPTVIHNNTINALEAASVSGSYIIGIAFAGNSEGAGEIISVVNNMINVGAETGEHPTYGIGFRSANNMGNIQAYHNTILLNDLASTSACHAVGNHTNGTGPVTLDLKNNIIINMHTGNSGSAAIGLVPTTSVLSSENNVLYSDQILVNYKGTTYADLAAWQASSKDQNSASKEVTFVDSVDLHLADPSDTDLDLVFAKIEGIDLDIDGDARAHPALAYAGADEGSAYSPPVDVVLNVIMKEQVRLGVLNLALGVVDVIGTFNEWEGTAMGDFDGDTTYSVTLELYPYSAHEFQFRMNGSTVEEMTREITVGTSGSEHTYWFNDDTLEVAAVGIPVEFALHQNYPNPFNPTTTINFDLPNAADVKLVVYDITGRKIRTLVNGHVDAGYKKIVWNGRDDFGNGVATGMYIYRIHAGDFVDVRKMTFLK